MLVKIVFAVSHKSLFSLIGTLRSARIYVVFVGSVFFLKKANDYYILFILLLECILRTIMVVGSPGIVADTSYDDINMAPVKN